MEKQAVLALKKIISLVPEGVVRFTYLKILKPKPLRIVADSFIKRITPKRVSLPEGVVSLNQGDPAVSGALALGAHDPFEIECFRENIKPGMNVVDIGANIGYYTVIAAGRVGPGGKVFAYEPEKSNFALLKANIAANKFTWVNALSTGLSNEPGKHTLFVAKGHTGIHSFADNRGGADTTVIETETLDRSLEKFGSPRIDLIKMDIEGAEALAIEGMRETLSKNPKIILFTEFYPQAMERLGHKPIQFLNDLKDLGFHLWVMDENAKGVVALPYGDFESFVHKFPPKGEVAKNIYASRYPA